MEAQYSVTWPVACALVDGNCGPQHSEPAALNNIALQNMFNIIQLVEKPEHSCAFPKQLLADVEIRFKDGSKIRAPAHEITPSPPVIRSRRYAGFFVESRISMCLFFSRFEILIEQQFI